MTHRCAVNGELAILVSAFEVVLGKGPLYCRKVLMNYPPVADPHPLYGRSSSFCLPFNGSFIVRVMFE